MAVVHSHLFKILQVHDVFRSSCVDENPFHGTFIYSFSCHLNFEDNRGNFCFLIANKFPFRKGDYLMLGVFVFRNEIRLVEIIDLFLIFLIDETSGVIMLITLSPLFSPVGHQKYIPSNILPESIF